MAITVIEACSTADAVAAGASTEFTASGPFTLYADHFELNQNVVLYRLGPSGDYLPATNRIGTIICSAFPNRIYVESGGTFRVKKDASAATVAVGYEVA